MTNDCLRFRAVTKMIRHAVQQWNFLFCRAQLASRKYDLYAIGIVFLRSIRFTVPDPKVYFRETGPGVKMHSPL